MEKSPIATGMSAPPGFACRRAAIARDSSIPATGTPRCASGRRDPARPDAELQRPSRPGQRGDEVDDRADTRGLEHVGDRLVVAAGDLLVEIAVGAGHGGNVLQDPLVTELSRWRAPVTIAGAMWVQRDITLQPRPRGFHLVTREIVGELAELAQIRAGLLHVHIQHTSASLTLNENASPEVRRDFETWFSAAVPESFGGWTHTLEGSDDMPAHIKASLLGPSVTVPVRNGRAHLGTWQGIYLCEHRDHGGPRTLTLTLNGE